MKTKINIGGEIKYLSCDIETIIRKLRELKEKGKLKIKIKDAKVVKEYLLNREKRREERMKEEDIIKKKRIREEYITLKKKIYEKIYSEKFFARRYDEYQQDDFRKFLELYSLIYNVKIVEEENFDNKKRGYFTKINVWGYGNGYAFIEHFWYSQWKSVKYSTERRNWFILGFTEENRTFLKNIKNMKKSTMHDVIFAKNTDEAKKIVWKFLTGYRITKNDIIQGDLLLKFIKKLNGEGMIVNDEEIREEKLRNHILRGSFEKVEDEYIIKHAVIMHNQHNIKIVPAGVYRAIFQKDYFVWGFSRFKSD